MGENKLSKANKRKIYLKASDFLLDLAKLVFGGIILTGIVDIEINKAYLFVFGMAVVIVMCILGYLMLVRGIKTN